MNGEVPHVLLGELLRQVEDVVDVRADQQYPNFGIYSFGRGVFPKPPISGGTSSANTLYRARAGQFVYSRLFAFEGAYGLVPDELDGTFVSNEFPLLEPVSPRLRIGYLAWYFRLARTWAEVATKATGMGSRRQRIHPEMIFAHAIPLPAPEEQDRIVATLDAAAARVTEAQRLCREIDQQADALLRSAFHRISDGAPHLTMSKVAPLVRRSVDVRMGGEYLELGVRSFGKGTFHKPALDFMAVGDKKLYHIEPGDLLFNNVFAWEGAIAVAQPEDLGRVGSHRFITCVAEPSLATPDYLAFYFKTPAGLKAIGDASPGGAGRNRTLGLDKLLAIPVPVPPIEHQRWFDGLQARLKGARAELVQIVTEAKAMIPSILDRAFKGELGTAAFPTVASAPLAVCAAPMIAGRINPPADNSAMSADMVPVLDDTGAAHASESSEMARVDGGAIVQTWNIPEIAAIQAELVRRNGDSATLGRKKISKGAYLAAALLGAKQNPPPLRKAAGPFNTQGQNEVEAYAAQAGWFRDTGQASGKRLSSRYRQSDRIAEAAAKAKGLVAARAANFERFMGQFVNWDSDTAELHATAHAAWNGLIAAGKSVSEAAIIETFFEWSEEKAKFTATQIRSALATLRSLGMEPNGGGPVVSGVGESNLFSGASR
ncbi:MAG: restriction endonuclease subunit S [Pirellulales bacterium]|nr:restriction endonuclease subunit S [Pirellulales bacterium]